MSRLIDILVTQLERPRDVTMQVATYLLGNYEVERDGVGEFLDQRLPSLEDYEHDLILSPLFTPKLADQAIFADLLGRESIPRDQWPALIAELVARPVRGHLVTMERKTCEVVLRDVTVERYLHRLRLDGSIPESLFVLLETLPPVSDRPTLKAVSRRAIWESEPRRDILVRYLTLAGDRGGYQLSDAVRLLDIAESYRPTDVAALLAMIPPWREGLKREIDTSSAPRPFFATQIQSEHGGDRDHRHSDEARVEAKRNEYELLGRLQQIFAD